MESFQGYYLLFLLLLLLLLFFLISYTIDHFRLLVFRASGNTNLRFPSHSFLICCIWVLHKGRSFIPPFAIQFHHKSVVFIFCQNVIFGTFFFISSFWLLSRQNYSIFKLLYIEKILKISNIVFRI